MRRVKVAQSVPSNAGPDVHVKEDPLTILKLRLAKGNLTVAQYNELKEVLK